MYNMHVYRYLEIILGPFSILMGSFLLYLLDDVSVSAFWSLRQLHSFDKQAQAIRSLAWVWTPGCGFIG